MLDLKDLAIISKNCPEAQRALSIINDNLSVSEIKDMIKWFRVIKSKQDFLENKARTR